MTALTQKELMTEMRDDIKIQGRSIAAIEMHLKDMNGKLIESRKHITEICPLKHDNLKNEFYISYNQLNSEIKKLSTDFKVNTTKYSIYVGLAAAVAMIIANVMLYKFKLLG